MKLLIIPLFLLATMLSLAADPDPKGVRQLPKTTEKIKWLPSPDEFVWPLPFKGKIKHDRKVLESHAIPGDIYGNYLKHLAKPYQKHLKDATERQKTGRRGSVEAIQNRIKIVQSQIIPKDDSIEILLLDLNSDGTDEIFTPSLNKTAEKDTTVLVWSKIDGEYKIVGRLESYIDLVQLETEKKGLLTKKGVGSIVEIKLLETKEQWIQIEIGVKKHDGAFSRHLYSYSEDGYKRVRGERHYLKTHEVTLQNVDNRYKK